MDFEITIVDCIFNVSRTASFNLFSLTNDIGRLTLFCKLTSKRLPLETKNSHTDKKMGVYTTKKNSDIFHIAAQNIDCGYSLEPPRRGESNEYPQSI